MYDNNSPESGHRGKLPQHNKGRIQQTHIILRLPCGSAGKEATCNAGDLGLIPGLGRYPGEGKCYPLQYSWSILASSILASLVAQTVKNLPAKQETQV